MGKITPIVNRKLKKGRPWQTQEVPNDMVMRIGSMARAERTSRTEGFEAKDPLRTATFGLLNRKRLACEGRLFEHGDAP